MVLFREEIIKAVCITFSSVTSLETHFNAFNAFSKRVRKSCMESTNSGKREGFFCLFEMHILYIEGKVTLYDKSVNLLNLPLGDEFICEMQR